MILYPVSLDNHNMTWIVTPNMTKARLIYSLGLSIKISPIHASPQNLGIYESDNHAVESKKAALFAKKELRKNSFYPTQSIHGSFYNGLQNSGVFPQVYQKIGRVF